MSSRLSPLQFLDMGSEQLTSNVSSAPQCPHPQSINLKNYGISFFPTLNSYRQRMAAWRFKELDFASLCPSDAPLQKYVVPVVAFFRKHLLPNHGDYTIASHEGTKNDSWDLVRIHRERDHKTKLFALLLFVPPRSDMLGRIARRPGVTSQQPDFLLVTDEHHVCIVQQIDLHLANDVQLVHYAASSGQTSLRNLLNFLLFQHSSYKFTALPWSRNVQGALNLPSGLDKPISRSPHAYRHQDYDRYTVQRSLPDLLSLLESKEKEVQRIFSNPVRPGTSFRVTVDAFAKEQGVWRCPFPTPPIPAQTHSYVSRGHRERLALVDSILDECTTTTFVVTDVVQHKPNTFSQVFFGFLRDPDGRESPLVCLKLFLDAAIPAKRDVLLDDFDEFPPRLRLRSLHDSDDLAHREESAYDRLKGYQGTMLPHCYGFHRFRLDGRFSAYGALLEIIHGPSLGDSRPSEWSIALQEDLVIHLRECLRALLYAGVDQGDFHGGQILLPGGRDGRPVEALVLIDFAFAVQRRGDEQQHGIAATLLENGIFTLKYLLERLRLQPDVIGPHFDPRSLHVHEY
ncbi:hypothetical protein HMN09_00189100 [Mycena chlorophos]|uniref:Protein kinase domain-containing protein n=1 Tax=Mycena chlorophos TaxID=658473 RepID=A0A8H6TPL1_MYCCL|nr:hypothetical protein HMN09_00189100 [Mycena chlorophos]